MSTDIEKRLRRAFIANGGSEQAFEASKADLLTQYRNQATITAALEEASRPLTMNDLLRGAMQERDDQSNDLPSRIVAGGANQKGESRYQLKADAKRAELREYDTAMQPHRQRREEALVVQRYIKGTLATLFGAGTHTSAVRPDHIERYVQRSMRKAA